MGANDILVLSAKMTFKQFVLILFQCIPFPSCNYVTI